MKRLLVSIFCGISFSGGVLVFLWPKQGVPWLYHTLSSWHSWKYEHLKAHCKRSRASAIGQQQPGGLPRYGTKHKTPTSPSGLLEQLSWTQLLKFQFLHGNPDTSVPPDRKVLIKWLPPCWLVLWFYSALKDGVGAEYHKDTWVPGMKAKPSDGSLGWKRASQHWYLGAVVRVLTAWLGFETSAGAQAISGLT